MRLLFFGTYDARRHPRVRVLQEGFAALGDEVLECNVPLAIDTARRVRAVRKPSTAPLLIPRVLGAWRELRARAKTFERPDAVVIGYMGHFDIHLAYRTFKGAPLVLDHLISAKSTALDRGVTSRPILSALDLVDRRALRLADVVCVDTPENLSLIGSTKARARAEAVPVGASNAWFQSPAPRGDELRVVFFGLYTPLQGAPVIARAIAELAKRGSPIRFTMVGGGQDYDDARRIADTSQRVEWIPWAEPEDLPSLVSRHDVCLGIFGTSAKALSVVPNKIFQGAAAGCAIVTSDTKPQRRTLGDAATFAPAGDHSALADVLEQLRRDRSRVTSLRMAASEHADRNFRPAIVVEQLRKRMLRGVR